MLSFLTIFGLALLDSMSAGTLVIPLALVMKQRGVQIRPLAVYFGTVCVSYFLLGVAILFGLEQLSDSLSGVLESDPVLWLQLVIGAVLLLYGVFTPEPPKSDGTMQVRQPRDLTNVSMIALALGAVVLEAATMVPYLAALTILGDAPIGQPLRLLILALYCFVMIVPALIAIVLVAVFGERIWSRLGRFVTWIERETKITLLWIAAIIGIYLIVNAVQKLGLL